MDEANNAHKLADEPAFIILSYIFAFFPWVYFAVSDHITARWEPSQRLVKRVWIALFVLLPSTAVLFAYIVIQYRAGDTKEALAAVVVLLAGFGPYVRTAREFWIMYAFRDFQGLLHSIPIFHFSYDTKYQRKERIFSEHLYSWLFPTIKYANSGSFFDNDSPGDGVQDLSLKQWILISRFYHAAKHPSASTSTT